MRAKLRRPFFHALCGALIALVLSPTALFAETSTYDVTTNGFRFGNLTVTTTLVASAYSIAVTAQAQGLLGFLTQSRYIGSANGKLANSGPQPAFFTARTQRIFKDRETSITFTNGRPTKVTLTPKKDHTNFTDPKSVTDKRVDSLSYFYQMFTVPAGKCPANGTLYDGRRLTEVNFETPTISDTTTSCIGEYRLTNGPDHSLQSGQRSYALVFEYTPQGGAPVRITVKSGGNLVVLDAVKYAPSTSH